MSPEDPIQPKPPEGYELQPGDRVRLKSDIPPQVLDVLKSIGYVPGTVYTVTKTNTDAHDDATSVEIEGKTLPIGEIHLERVTN